MSFPVIDRKVETAVIQLGPPAKKLRASQDCRSTKELHLSNATGLSKEIAMTYPMWLIPAKAARLQVLYFAGSWRRCSLAHLSMLPSFFFPGKVLVDLQGPLLPHDEMMKKNLLVQWRPGHTKTVVLISHQRLGEFDLFLCRVPAQSHTCSGGLASDIQILTWSSSKFCRAFFATLLLVESALARTWLRSPWPPWQFHFTRLVPPALGQTPSRGIFAS